MKPVTILKMDIIGGSLGLVLVLIFFSQGGVGSTQPCTSSSFSLIPASLTDQDYATAILASIDDPQWCINSTYSDNPFHSYLCIYYSNSGECLSCESICGHSEPECESRWRCGRFPQKIDGTKLNVTFYMVHTNESAYRPTTTQPPITTQNLTESNTPHNSTTPIKHPALTTTEKPSGLPSGEIAWLVIGVILVTGLAFCLLFYLIRFFRKRKRRLDLRARLQSRLDETKQGARAETPV